MGLHFLQHENYRLHSYAKTCRLLSAATPQQTYKTIKLSLFCQNTAELGLVGPLGFEPRIACAPGMYPNPDSKSYSQDTRLKGTALELSKLDDGPTKHIQKRAEEHAKHGFHLNLNESPAYEDYNQRIINTLERCWPTD